MTGNRRILLLLPVLAIAGWLALFGDKTPSKAPVASAVNVAAPVAQASAPAGDAPADSATENLDEAPADPTTVHKLRVRTYLTGYENAQKIDLFQGRPVDAPPPPEEKKDDAPPPPPPKPPQPFTVIGRMLDDTGWIVFVEHAGRSYVARTGSVVEGFRFDAVESRQIRLTNLADKEEYVIPVGDDKKEPEHE